MRTSAQQQQLIEQRIRAAMDRLLRGELPASGGCDIKTLAAEAGVTRSALYSTYKHLRAEFEQRRERLHQAGNIIDPRQQQIAELKQRVAALQVRLAERDQIITRLNGFRTTALSRLAAQHDEILHLRGQLIQHSKIRLLRPAAASSESGSSWPSTT